MSKIVKMFTTVSVLFLFSCASIFADAITTASDYFKSVSNYYSSIKDYEAEIEINVDKKDMTGKVSYKRPNLLRIDFTNPENQVIVFNGDNLTIYLPGNAAILEQTVQSDGNASSLATPQGLSLMSRYYIVAYEIGQDPVPLDAGSEERVIKLVLTRRNSTEAFTKIKLAISADTKLIRRVEATTTKNEVFEFNFLKYKLNQDITDQRFIYDAPSSANNYKNFLFSE